MSEEHIWKTLLSNLEQNKQAVVVVIIQRTGSAPNIPGAKMLVTTDKVMGTVGGGISEHKLLEHARTLLEEKIVAVETVFMDHSETATEHRSGMICSGSQTFALISLGKQDIVTIKNITEVFSKGQSGILTLNQEGINFAFGDSLTDDNIYTEEDSSWTYQENIGVHDKLFIIGGGHVSLALSRIMETLGFHITVVDDRKNLPTMDANSYAHERIVMSYKNILSIIPQGNNIYVTIMTFGHSSDELVLENLIAKKIKYLGMMASDTKKHQIFTNLKNIGISKAILDTVHSPIGLKINSHTPEEIAISIAAEIIFIKNS